MSGNLWMFSDKLDDEDIEILKHEFITYYQGADYFGLGLQNTQNAQLTTARSPTTGERAVLFPCRVYKTTHVIARAVP